MRIAGFLLLVLAINVGIVSISRGDEPAAKPADKAPADKLPAEKAPTAEQIQALETLLSGSKLVGQFTVTGKTDGKLAKEEYVIASAKKLAQGDSWLLTASIKYGKTDVTLPIPLEIKWAGDTPVITLSKVTIPGLGTFSSRVVIHDGKYAGTWQHDQVGGHLFGTVERAEAKPPEKKP